jgi:hypothetical protein
MKPKDKPAVKVLTEEEKKAIKKLADDKKKQTSNPQIIKK